MLRGLKLSFYVCHFREHTYSFVREQKLDDFLKEMDKINSENKEASGQCIFWPQEFDKGSLVLRIVVGLFSEKTFNYLWS